MIKRILIFILVIAAAVGFYYGYKEYKWRQTPGYATTKFVEALGSDPNEAYKWLSSELLKDREDYWLKYLANFTGKDLREVYGGSPLNDPLDAYGDVHKPYRMQFFVSEPGNPATQNTVTITLVQQEGDWKVDELFDSGFIKSK
ncbi:MAG TPA: hypothetical protein VF733_02530 [Candidatus Saccharimonadales bacterium]